MTPPRPPALPHALAAAAPVAVLLAAFVLYALPVETSGASTSLQGFARASALAGTGLLLRPALPAGPASDLAWSLSLGAVALAWAPAGTRAVALGVVLVLLLASALTALVARVVREPGAPQRATLVAVIAAAAAPVWASPLAEQSGGTEYVLAASPFTLLASLAGHDYLRDPWWYTHSALGALRFEYPPGGALVAAYLCASALLLAIAGLSRRTSRSIEP